MDDRFGQAYIDECNDWRNRRKEALLITHLTLTGYYAGTPICGINKQEAKQQGDSFVHAAYAHLDSPHFNFCPDCLDAWEEANDEDN